MSEPVVEEFGLLPGEELSVPEADAQHWATVYQELIGFCELILSRPELSPKAPIFTGAGPTTGGGLGTGTSWAGRRIDRPDPRPCQCVTATPIPLRSPSTRREGTCVTGKIWEERVRREP